MGSGLGIRAVTGDSVVGRSGGFTWGGVGVILFFTAQFTLKHSNESKKEAFFNGEVTD